MEFYLCQPSKTLEIARESSLHLSKQIEIDGHLWDLSVVLSLANWTSSTRGKKTINRGMFIKKKL